jgi:hypothetical protein
MQCCTWNSQFRSHIATLKSYLSPFNNLPKDNGPPYPNSVKLGQTRMWYSIEAVAKDNCYPLKGVDKGKHISFNNFKIIISGRHRSFGNSRTVLANKSFKFELYRTMAAIFCGFWKLIWNNSFLKHNNIISKKTTPLPHF